MTDQTALVDQNSIDRLLDHERSTDAEMTSAMRLGRSCLWCSVSTRDSPLVELLRIEKHALAGCVACCLARLDSLNTYEEWLSHVKRCDVCRSGVRCAAGDPFARAHDEARQRAGKKRFVVCLCCRVQEPVAQPRVVPHAWTGVESDRTYYSYRHSGVTRLNITAESDEVTFENDFPLPPLREAEQGWPAPPSFVALECDRIALVKRVVAHHHDQVPVPLPTYVTASADLWAQHLVRALIMPPSPSPLL
ncbi:hypothetical protein [Streptomyces sp. Tu 6176]|uniref:hypothetical protein n=1 Tax=Streptomyces sp. Tu 6176 TaxID=1470557 RepID=UPI00055A4425|nr:hypothetical protein [Streptomyces sp. Tu 6176]